MDYLECISNSKLQQKNPQKEMTHVLGKQKLGHLAQPLLANLAQLLGNEEE